MKGSSACVEVHETVYSLGCFAGTVLPMEILPLGEFDPVYRSTLDVQSGELPVLPLSIYGAVRPRHRWQLLIAVLAQSRGAERWSEGLDMHLQLQLVLHHISARTVMHNCPSTPLPVPC